MTTKQELNMKDGFRFERSWTPPSHYFKPNLYETVFDINYINKEVERNDRLP